MDILESNDMSRKIQAVFFDMGGTIETFRYDRELRLRAVPGLLKLLHAAEIDLHLSDEQFLDLFTDRYKKYHQWRKQTLQELPSWQIWSDYILSDYPQYYQPVRAISEELTEYYENNLYKREMRPEMPSVLEAIKKLGLKIGVISNVSSFGQVPKNLEQYGIRHYFNPVVLSSEYGRRKPDPAIFHYAARLADVPASHCLYVGDLVSRDVIGARKAGYRMVVQVRHDFSQDDSDGDTTPDVFIENMSELLGVLESERLNLPASSPDRDIQAILFDAGDILYHRPRSGEQFKAFLNKLDIQPDRYQAEDKKKLSHQAYLGQISQEQYWEAFIRLQGISDPEQVELGKEILAAEGDDVDIIEGVPETLAALKKSGFLLGIVTDTATSISRKLQWFEKGGFGNVWDSIISSKEIGIRKPDPRIYQAALKQLGVSVEKAVFVGHNANELDGARAIGLKTIAFNYDAHAQADIYIDRFADLLQVPLIASTPINSTR